MAFQRIETRRKSAYVAEQIVEAIRDGQYGVADRLPPERVLAEQMGVSRPSVREALSALQIVGIVESRPGNGTYVRNRADFAQAMQVMRLLEESPSPVEALEARRALELGIVRHVVEKRSPEGLARLREALAAMDEAAEASDYDAFSRTNVEFHLALARAGGNALIEQTIRPLLEVMRQQLALELRRQIYEQAPFAFRRSFDLHAAIVHGIEAADLEGAVAAVERHFDAIEQALRD